MSATVAHRIEAVVIGAGVLGLACARALAMAGKEVIILERESIIGSGISSRNSEVVHAGLYYPNKSLKAQLCVRGRELLYDYCQERKIEYSKIGKLIVATSPEQLQSQILNIKTLGESNGVPNLKLLSKEDVRIALDETEVNCHGALFSPETGVVDSHQFMMSLLGDVEHYGAMLALNSCVDDIFLQNNNQKGRTNGIYVKSNNTTLHCDILVNCAGLFAGHIGNHLLFSRQKQQNCGRSANSSNIGSGSIHGSIATHNTPTQQFYAKGNYYRLEGQKTPFRHLIYPVPEPGGLGVHATIDLGGNCRFGPDVEWIDPYIKDPDDIDLTVDPTRADLFYEQVRKYWPGLKDGALAPDYAGIRPKLEHLSLHQDDNDKSALSRGLKAADFLIHGEKQHGIKGYIHLMGIESPGLTSSLAIGEKVMHLLR